MTKEHQKELARFKKDTAYFEAHREELLTQYPEQWVVIYNQQVVAASPDYEKLLDMVEAKGLPLGQVLVQHLTTKDEVLILPL